MIGKRVLVAMDVERTTIQFISVEHLQGPFSIEFCSENDSTEAS
jgi:hypothetical protein